MTIIYFIINKIRITDPFILSFISKIKFIKEKKSDIFIIGKAKGRILRITQSQFVSGKKEKIHHH